MCVGIFAFVGSIHNLILRVQNTESPITDMLLMLFMMSTATSRLVVVIMHRLRPRCVVCAVMFSTVFVLVCDCVAQSIISGDGQVRVHSAWYYVEVAAVILMGVMFKSWEVISSLLAKALVEKDSAQYKQIWENLLGAQRDDIKHLVDLVSELQDEVRGCTQLRWPARC